MFLFSLFRKSAGKGQRSRRVWTFRPSLEGLETRLVPATVTLHVNNLSDTPVDGETNFRQALTAINTDSITPGTAIPESFSA